MSSYRQLSLEERCTIAQLHAAGRSNGQIAAALGRPTSTIGRELKRNSGSKVGYQPAYAQQLTQARRWSSSRLERDTGLREVVLDRLARGWSPEQVCGRLALEAGRRIISHETIYRFIHDQARRTNDGSWRHYLPRGRLKRGRHRKRGGWPRIAGRTSIHDRPAHIAARTEPGHWEADTMLFSTPGQALLIAHERQSRLTIAVRQPSLRADPVARALADMFHRMPPHLRRSITFDNGTQFSRHQRIAQRLGAKTYFCDPHSPWQKGSIENAIGRLRRNLPRKTDLAALPREQLDAILAAQNNTPRKCLGFKTPNEAFIPLHFKCEATPGSRPG